MMSIIGLMTITREKKIKFLSTLTESRIEEFFKLQIETDADLWLIEVVSKDFDLHDLFLKQGL